VLLLLLLNVGFWAYTQGHFAPLGWAPDTQREPQRLAQQIAPEKLRVVNAPAAGSAQAAKQDAPGDSAAAAEGTTDLPSPPVPGDVPAETAVPPTTARPLPTTCWQASGFTAAQTVLLTGALQNMDGLAPGAWRLTETVLPARWIVYIGKLPNSDAVQRRKAELRQAKIEYRDVYNPALQPGLALGTYSTEEAAQRALRDVSRQGVRDARVVQERKESTSVGLSLPALTDAQRRQLLDMGVLGDKTLQPCP
jgi:hypothetical protein